MIDFHDNALLSRTLEIGFHPFIRGLSASTPRIWHTSLFVKPRCRYQSSRANSKISYTVGTWHASRPLRSETVFPHLPHWLNTRLPHPLLYQVYAARWALCCCTSGICVISRALASSGQQLKPFIVGGCIMRCGEGDTLLYCQFQMGRISPSTPSADLALLASIPVFI